MLKIINKYISNNWFNCSVFMQINHKTLYNKNIYQYVVRDKFNYL